MHFTFTNVKCFCFEDEPTINKLSSRRKCVRLGLTRSEISLGLGPSIIWEVGFIFVCIHYYQGPTFNNKSYPSKNFY